MPFLSRFFGSFHSQALYARLRTGETGYGAHYSLLLFGFIAVVSTIVIILNAPEQLQQMMPRMQSAPVAAWVVIFAVALLLRAMMLLSLAVTARLIAIRMKLPMDYPAGFRLAGVAYTPVAAADAVVFCLQGQTLNPLLLFTCGAVMLLAALHSTR